MAAATASEDGARTSWRLIAIYDASFSPGFRDRNQKKKKLE